MSTGWEYILYWWGVYSGTGREYTFKGCVKVSHLMGLVRQIMELPVHHAGVSLRGPLKGEKLG
jgi:hypothetical protein